MAQDAGMPAGGQASEQANERANEQANEQAGVGPEEARLLQLVEQVDAETRGRAGAPGAHPEFDRLARTIWRLRQPDGCPWDKAQTHTSIVRNMIEEAYEAVDAIEADDATHLLEELGDVLEQVLLHSQIEADDGGFCIDDVCRELNEKLVRRHPHVFGDGSAADAAEALDSWDEVKRKERAAAGATAKAAGDAPEGSAEPGLLDSIPQGMPALMQCQKVSKRAAKAGFEWDTTADVWDKVAEERAEFEAEERGSERAEEEFGDVLFALVNVARKEGIDAEEALRRSTAKFRRRWASMEAACRARGVRPEDLSTAELNVLWDEAKAQE